MVRASPTCAIPAEPIASQSTPYAIQSTKEAKKSANEKKGAVEIFELSVLVANQGKMVIDDTYAILNLFDCHAHRRSSEDSDLKQIASGCIITQ
jgi:hypothetical protein